MKQFGYHEAESVSHAVDLANKYGADTLFIAGGQSLTNVMKTRLVGDDSHVIDLKDLDELSYIRDGDEVVHIGAMTTHAEIVESTLLADRIPAFPEMVAQVGDVQIRNMGTIGGDMAQADPQADYPVLLEALGGRAKIRSSDGEQTEPLSEFFVSYFMTVLGETDLLVEVKVDVPGEDAAAGFDKFAQHKGDFPIVNAAAVVAAEDGVCVDARVRVGCVSGAPVTATDAESYLEETLLADVRPGRAGERARAGITPDPDEDVDLKFKNDLVEKTVKSAVGDAVDRLKG